MFGHRLRGGFRAIQATPWGDWGDSAGTTWAGPNVTTTSAMQLLAVYGCVRFICDGIATLPVDVFREDANGVRTEVPKPAWLDRPTVDLDRIAWLTQVLSSLLLAGNSYCRKVYDDQFRLIEVVPLNPSMVSVRREQGRKVFAVNGQPVDPFEILHIPGLMLSGADVGLSPVDAARQTVGKGMAVEEFGARFFGQGANLGGVIEDPGELDVARARAMARGWARLHSGNRKAHLPGVLQGGATWKQISVPPDQAQFLQTQQFTASQIASHMFLIDPTEFGVSMDKGSSITYANLEQRNARKVNVTYLPWIVRVEAALSGLLPQPRFVKLNVAGLLRGDSSSRWANYKTASDISTAAVAVGDKPVMLTEEMRGLEDMPPLAANEVPTPPAPAPAGAPAGMNGGQ